MAIPWFDRLKQLVEQKPIVVLRFDKEEWNRLLESRRGVSEFTVARSHSLLEKAKVPMFCLIRGTTENQENLYFGLISSRSAVTTLESRIKVKRVVSIQPRSESELASLVTQQPHAKNLRDRLHSRAAVITLSPKLSSHVIEKLGAIDANRGAMRAVTESLSAPKNFRSVATLQEDAVRTALKAFGLAAD